MAFVLPLVWVPGYGNSNRLAIISRLPIVVITVLFAAFVLATIRTKSQRRAPRAVNLPIVAALGFAVWLLAASAFADWPVLALTGDVLDYFDAALWYLCLALLYVVTYVSVVRGLLSARLISISTITGGFVIALIAVFETSTGISVFWSESGFGLPIAMYPQKGHLSGFLLLVSAMLLPLSLRDSVGLRSFLLILGLGLMVFSIGTTSNRSAMGAMALIGFIAVAVWWIRSGCVKAKLWRGLSVLLVVGIGLFGGMQFSAQANPDGAKVIASTSTLELRFMLWEMAVEGIRSRPILGYGGGQFHMAIPTLVDEALLHTYIAREFGLTDVTETLESTFHPQFIGTTTESDHRVVFTWTGMKAHNEFLDVAIIGGVVAAVLFGLLVLLGIWQATQLNVVSIGILAYAVFLQFWFAPAHVEPTLWILMATGASWLPNRPRDGHRYVLSEAIRQVSA